MYPAACRTVKTAGAPLPKPDRGAHRNGIRLFFVFVIRLGEVSVHNIVLRCAVRPCTAALLSCLRLGLCLCRLVQLFRNLVERLLRLFGFRLNGIGIRSLESFLQLVDFRLNLFLLPSRPTVGFGISPNQRMARGL